MGLSESQLKSDQAVVFSDFPTETATISGTSYSVLVLDNQLGSDWSMGGETITRSIRIAIERSKVSTIPSEGDAATFRSVSYRVGNVESDDLSASITIELHQPTLT